LYPIKNALDWRYLFRIMDDMTFAKLLYYKYRPSSKRRRFEARVGKLDQSSIYSYMTPDEIAAEFATIFRDKQFCDKPTAK